MGAVTSEPIKPSFAHPRYKDSKLLQDLTSALLVRDPKQRVTAAAFVDMVVQSGMASIPL